jgi:predicted nuclease with TOPRIM domain
MTIKEWEKSYDRLQERFQTLWFENHQIKERNIQLEDKIRKLEEKLAFQQDNFK